MPALRSVHTVTIHDFGRDPTGTLYLAMELLEGEPERCAPLTRPRMRPSSGSSGQDAVGTSYARNASP
jgi:hypothetical protein